MWLQRWSQQPTAKDLCRMCSYHLLAMDLHDIERRWRGADGLISCSAHSSLSASPKSKPLWFSTGFELVQILASIIADFRPHRPCHPRSCGMLPAKIIVSSNPSSWMDETKTVPRCVEWHAVFLMPGTWECNTTFLVAGVLQILCCIECDGLLVLERLGYLWYFSISLGHSLDMFTLEIKHRLLPWCFLLPWYFLALEDCSKR